MTTEVQREVMEADVLIVGGGSAGLAAAIELKNQIDKHNEEIASGKKTGEPIAEQMIVVLEKAAEVGNHSMSGAVLNPVALKELLPNYKELGCPLDAEVSKEGFYFLTESGTMKSPIIPPPFHNGGNYIVSLAKFNKWLGEQAAVRGINIFPGFSAVEVLYDGDRIVGVRTDDKGLDKDGKPKGNFQPGMLLKAKVTIFAEGTRGSLFKTVAKKLNLFAGKNEEAFELGVKEVIQMPAGSVEAGQVIHTMGYPFHKSVGGTFIYTIPGDKIIVGVCAYLDTRDPLLDPHRDLQRFKAHPFMQKLLSGGKVVAYGGKTLPAGGWYSMPKLFADGMMVIGDSASMVNVQKLKGIHLAMKSGMLAAHTALDAILKHDFSSATLKSFEQKVHDSYIKSELYQVRNFHQALGKGMVGALPHLALQQITGGRGFCERMTTHKDSSTTESVLDVWGADAWGRSENKLPKPDGKLFFDKLSSVYLTGTMHDENSPDHLLVADRSVCSDLCAPKFQSPCNHFCPANVYEMVDDSSRAGKKKLQVNYTNCIHCKTCDIKCPFDNITWTVPEGSGGPRYSET